MKKFGISAELANEDFTSSTLSCFICEKIQQARFIICDLSEQNANVYYELGLAFGLSRKVILIYQPSGREIASDLLGMMRVEYDRTKLVQFRKDLEQKFTLIEKDEYTFDPYLSNYMYRVLNLNLDLSVIDHHDGDTNTMYDITVECITRDADDASVNFIMPYHDTPNFPTKLDEFNLMAKLFDNDEPLEIDWILKSLFWKRFNVKLPSICYEGQYRFVVSMHEKGLYYRDEKSDFYDFQIHYPTESVDLQIHLPPSWLIANMSIVDADTGQPAHGVTKYELQRSENQNTLIAHMVRPKVGSTYPLQWEWDDL